MSEEVKIEVIRNTQKALSRYIKKPPLTEKLLRKPPFRYLHDITTSVMRETGYLQGLYTKDELNPENIKDREAKIAFLDKLITVVNLSSGVTVTAKPNKIVAGLDVAKTNELLQAIAEALEKKVDSSEAVEKVLNKKNKGGNQSTSKKEIPKSKPVKSSETKTKSDKKADSSTIKKKAKEKNKTVDKPEVVPLKSGEDETTAPSVEENSVAVKNDEKKEKEENLSAPDLVAEVNEPRPKEILQKSEEGKAGSPSSVAPESSVLTEVDNSVQPEEIKRPQSARAVHRKKPTRKTSIESDTKIEDKNANNVPNESTNAEPRTFDKKDTSSLAPKKKPAMPEPIPATQPLQTPESPVKRERPMSSAKRPRTAARPPSARPGAPRVRDRGSVVLADTDKVVIEPIHVIEDTKDLSKEDDDAIVKVEISKAEEPVQQAEWELEEAGQGQLVSHILETQRELGNTSLDTPLNKVDISWGSGKQKKSESLARDVARLQEYVQAVTRAANPLGQIIDYLQEDVEAMQAELKTWVDMNQQLSLKLKEEERLTEECMGPLSRRLQELNQQIEDQLEDTSIVKAAILCNDKRLETLLTPPT